MKQTPIREGTDRWLAYLDTSGLTVPWGWRGGQFCTARLMLREPVLAGNRKSSSQVFLFL